MCNAFENLCKHIVDDAKHVCIVNEDNNLFDDQFVDLELNKDNVEYYENSKDKTYMIRLIDTKESYYLYSFYAGGSKELTIIGVLNGKDFMQNMERVYRQNEELPMPTMSYKFTQIVNLLNIMGVAVIVESYHDDYYKDLKPIISWNLIQKYNKYRFYEDLKRERYSVVIGDNRVYYLGSGCVGDKEYPLAVRKRDRRSLQGFIEVKEEN